MFFSIYYNLLCYLYPIYFGIFRPEKKVTLFFVLREYNLCKT